MNRFFVDTRDMSGNRFRITGTDVRHIQRVLRLGPGDRIVVVSPQGREWEGRLDRVDNHLAAGTLLSEITVSREPRLEITLIQGLPKAGKMDDIIQKGTELGMVRFLPLICERSVVRLDKDQGRQKVTRWQRIAQEAAKQARRSVIPEVTSPVTLPEVLSQSTGDGLDVLLWEGETNSSLQDLGPRTGTVLAVRLLVGPEGGFSPEEARQAEAAGFHAVTLGPRILRTETAGLVAAAALLYASGDLGGRG